MTESPPREGSPPGAADAVGALFRQAWALHQQGRLAEARAGYEAVLQRDPNHAEALNLAGVIGFQTGQMEQGLMLVRRAIAANPNVAMPYANLGQALARLGRFAEAAEPLSRAAALDPGGARAHAQLGAVLLELGQDQAALESLDRALRLHPDMIEALTDRAVVLRRLGRPGESLDGLIRAARLAPGVAGVRYNLGTLLRDLRRYDEALAELDAAIGLQPAHAGAHYSRGVILAELQRSAEAIAAFDRAIALRSDYVEAVFGRGLSRLQLGDFARGLVDHEQRKSLPVRLGHRPYAEPEWLDGQDLAGKTLLLHHEQGFGDTFMFARYARLAEAAGATVTMSVQTPLVRVMRTLSPTIAVIGEDQRPERFDLHAPLMSLPLAFGTTADAVPAEARYLSSEETLRARWAERLPATGRRRIGVVWASNRQNLRLAQRSVGLEAIKPLLDVDADWISLQKDPASGEADAFAALGGVHLGDQLDDFADTAALLDLMDLVVTVDTSVAHLAGAMGRPAFVLLAFNPDWRWFLGRADSPWYPSVRLFRQPAPGDWTSVVIEVKAALQA
jgi:tetratricopeptide (TPR) repeat protein